MDAVRVADRLAPFWFVAVAFIMRFRPTFVLTPPRAAGAFALLLPAKLIQEWALHVGRLFDGTSFIGAMESIWCAITAPFGLR